MLLDLRTKYPMLKINKCLICYDHLDDAFRQSCHDKCSKKLFGTTIVPEVEFGLDQVEKTAEAIVRSRLVVTGIQPKLSVEIKNKKETDKPILTRVTFTGLWGKYILKPPHAKFLHMPEIEDVSMHLAEVCGIKTALHGLIPLKSGELAYISKRFDRADGKKLSLEDMCQLSELLTEDKYHSSMEKAGKIILKHSSNPGNDVISLVEIALFSYLIGNADMHLKNSSLLTQEDGTVGLSPAYDLLATKLLTPADPEEMALTINGKKSRLNKRDFVTLARTLKISERATSNIFERLQAAVPKMIERLNMSMVPEDTIRKYEKLIVSRAHCIFS